MHTSSLGVSSNSIRLSTNLDLQNTGKSTSNEGVVVNHNSSEMPTSLSKFNLDTSFSDLFETGDKFEDHEFSQLIAEFQQINEHAGDLLAKYSDTRSSTVDKMGEHSQPHVGSEDKGLTSDQTQSKSQIKASDLQETTTGDVALKEEPVKQSTGQKFLSGLKAFFKPVTDFFKFIGHELSKLTSSKDAAKTGGEIVRDQTIKRDEKLANEVKSGFENAKAPSHLSVQSGVVFESLVSAKPKKDETLADTISGSLGAFLKEIDVAVNDNQSNPKNLTKAEFISEAINDGLCKVEAGVFFKLDETKLKQAAEDLEKAGKNDHRRG